MDTLNFDHAQCKTSRVWKICKDLNPVFTSNLSKLFILLLLPINSEFVRSNRIMLDVCVNYALAKMLYLNQSINRIDHSGVMKNKL